MKEIFNRKNNETIIIIYKTYNNDIKLFKIKKLKHKIISI